MGVECRACWEAARSIQTVLDSSPVRCESHPDIGAPDEVGDLWDATWDGIDEQIMGWPLARVLAELPLCDDLAAAFDRHAVESDPAHATADDVVRGTLVRSLVDKYVNRWVLAHS